MTASQQQQMSSIATRLTAAASYVEQWIPTFETSSQRSSLSPNLRLYVPSPNGKLSWLCATLLSSFTRTTCLLVCLCVDWAEFESQMRRSWSSTPLPVDDLVSLFKDILMVCFRPPHHAS
jgi:hypothetical protein